MHVGDWFYRDIPDLRAALHRRRTLLTSEVLWEASADAFAGEFPHVYGPIALDAVRAGRCRGRAARDGFEIPEGPRPRRALRLPPLEVGEAELEVGLFEAAVDLEELAGDEAAGG